MSLIMVCKKHIFKIILLCMLLSMGLLSIYAIRAYNGDTVSVQYKMRQPNLPKGKTAPLPQNMNQKPERQLPFPNSTQGMAPPNGGMPNGIADAGGKYAPQIILYAVIFLMIAVCSFFTLRKKKIDPGNEKMLIVTLLCVGFLVRISFATLVLNFRT